MWRLLWKNLIRNKRRMLLTASSVAVSLFLLSSLAVVYTAFGRPLSDGDATPILMVRRAAGIVFPLPTSYEGKIRAVPGVVACARFNWFGGYWVDPANFFANFAVEADTIFDVLRGHATIAPEQLEAFKRDRAAAVAGRQLIEKYRWKIGDRITLLGSPYGITPELTLRGVFTGGPDDQFFFHWDYMNEALGRPDYVGLYEVRLERPEDAARVAQAIDRMFRNTDAETKTESLNAFLLNFISMLGNVRAIILMIGAAVTFTILLIVANTMAMSIRERIPEAAVLRSLGFRAVHIMILFVGESLLLTLAGTVLGVGSAKILYDRLSLSKFTQFIFADTRMRPETILLCFSLAILIALVAAGLPAYRAARLNIAEALRHTG
jgi:putative ABC transport system permease protein